MPPPILAQANKRCSSRGSQRGGGGLCLLLLIVLYVACSKVAAASFLSRHWTFTTTNNNNNNPMLLSRRDNTAAFLPSPSSPPPPPFSSSSSKNRRRIRTKTIRRASDKRRPSSSSSSSSSSSPATTTTTTTLTAGRIESQPGMPAVLPIRAEPPQKRSSAIAGGFQQIWDTLAGGLPPEGEEGGGGGGSNTAFKVMLASVAMVYGTNFGAIKYLDEANVDVSIVTAIRFALATLALCPFLYKAPWNVVIRGAEVGAWVSTGYIAQAIGLQTTQASKSAFICSLSVVVVPIVNAIIYKKKAPPTTWIASLLAVIGVGLLTLEGQGGGISVGDLWSLGQPLGFGIAFVRTEQCMSENKGQALAMTAAQMAAVLAFSMLWVSFTLTAKMPDLSVLYDPINLAALFYTGVVTSAFAVVAESVALAHISAEETTVILSTEPLWAALFGAVVLGETMNGYGYLGGLVILAGCLLANLKLPKGLDALLGGGGGGEEEKED